MCANLVYYRIIRVKVLMPEEVNADIESWPAFYTISPNDHIPLYNETGSCGNFMFMYGGVLNRNTDA